MIGKVNNISGVLLLNKPIGISSNGALQTIKKIYNAKKAGHTGSLDPKASGMLPICFGEATKFSQYLLNAKKHYYARIKLGCISSTGDSEGEIVECGKVPELTQSYIESILEGFKGKQEQIPPMYSAIKQNGKPLYKLARAGIEVERKVREIEIYKISLINFTNDELLIDVVCSKGTYIRTLAESIGKSFETGAYLLELMRYGVGDFQEQMYTLEEIKDIADKGLSNLYDLLLPIDSMLSNMPSISLMQDQADLVLNGVAINVDIGLEGLFRLMLNNRHFIGIGKILSEGKLAPIRLLANIA